MKKRSLMMVAIGAALTLGTAGCGGGGGGSSSPGGGGGGNSAGLTANLTVLGGTLGTAINAGTQDISLTDTNLASHTVTSVFVPDAIQALGSVTVIKTGSVLITGHYTSTTATLIDRNNVTSIIPITSTGAFVHDTAIESAGTVHLPIDKIGNLSFPNGITVLVSATDSSAGFQFHNLTLNATVAIPSAQKTDGQMVFDGTGAPQCSLVLNFNSDLTHDLILQTVLAGNSPEAITGVADGTTTTYPNATVSYVYSD